MLIVVGERGRKHGFDAVDRPELTHRPPTALRRIGILEPAHQRAQRVILGDRISEAAAEPSDTAAVSEADRGGLVQQGEASFVHDVRPPSTEPDAGPVETAADRHGVDAWPDA